MVKFFHYKILFIYRKEPRGDFKSQAVLFILNICEKPIMRK